MYSQHELLTGQLVMGHLYYSLMCLPASDTTVPEQVMAQSPNHPYKVLPNQQHKLQ
jgi:hypothetical protein